MGSGIKGSGGGGGGGGEIIRLEEGRVRRLFHSYSRVGP